MSKKHGRARWIVPLSLASCLLLFAGALVFFLSRSPRFVLFSPGCVVVNAQSGRVLYEKEPGARREPASMTKLAALYLFFDALKDGRLQKDELVPVSENAALVPASRAGLRAGEAQTVDTLLSCIWIASGSDAVIALGERLYGDEQALLEAMNGKMSDLGLRDTVFVNCVGLSQEGHFSTAADIARLSCALIEEHPEVLLYSSRQAGVLTHADGEQKNLYSTNKLLGRFGVDGLKTGHTEAAGYCQSITYSAGARRYVIVLMGARSDAERGEDAETLMAAFR